MQFLKYIIDCNEFPFPEYEEIARRFKKMEGKATAGTVSKAVRRLDGDYVDRFDLLHGIRIREGSWLHQKVCELIHWTAQFCRENKRNFPQWQELADSLSANLEVETGKTYRFSEHQIRLVFYTFPTDEQRAIQALRKQ